MRLREFNASRSGSTAIEYALIAALIAIGLILGLRALSGNLATNTNSTSEKVSNALD